MTRRAPMREMPRALPRRPRMRLRARGPRRLRMLAAMGLLVASAAGADVYKCTGPQGQVTYSESPCAGQPSVKMDLRPPVENRDPAPPASVAPPPPAPPAVAAAPATLPTANAQGYELSYGDRQRIASLEQIERTSSAYAEQRRSATLEVASIRRGALARMTPDDLAKKSAYWADLGKIDPERRRAAAAQLANLLSAYP